MKKYLILNILIFCSITSFGEEKKADMPELRNEMINILNTATALTDEQDDEIREKGILPTCQKGDVYQLGLCYSKCKEGTTGIGPYCWQNCRDGFKDAGITCYKLPETHKKPNYNRGIGKAPICPSGKEKKVGLCYDKCKSGYFSSGIKCKQKCPSGYRDFGWFCYKRWWSWKRKNSYNRGIGKLPSSCPKGKEIQTGRCYPKCKKKFKGNGPLCVGTCPQGYEDKGVACIYSGEIYGKSKVSRKTEAPIYSGIRKPKNIKYIKDEKGRSLILHGVNTSNSAKGNPENMSWITEKDVIQETKEFGMNAVRLLIFWSAIEPQKGVYDDKYLDKVAKRVKWYTDNGAWVILDMHQDIYGKAVGGNGAPEWATNTEPFEEFEGKKVTSIDKSLKHYWWLENINPATMQAFINFWNYKEQKYRYLQNHYVGAWKKVAQRFKDTPGVLGYDLMNEPHDADLQDTFEINKLGELYKRVIRGIREYDNDKWIFFEPRSFGVNFGIPSFLKKVEDVRSGEPRLVYAPHMYPPLIHENVPYGSVDRKSVSMWSQNRSIEVDLHKAPLWVGEIGSSEKVDGFFTYIEEALNILDYMGASWMWWSNDPSQTWGLVDGERKGNEKLHYLVRTYPRAIAGHPLAHSFDVNNGTFRLKFQTLDNVNGKTEIFVPRRHYPNGYEIKVFNQTSGTKWSHTYDKSSQILYLSTENIGTPYTVLIKRKK